MSARRRYLVCYDIRDERRLRRVHKAMQGWGDPLQYSVFISDLDRRELILMRGDLGQLVNQSEDSVVIVDLGAPVDSLERVQFLGTPISLPDGGARII